MKIERNEEEIPGEHMKRQLYMMSNLGLFYIILIALFGIPLLGTFVVVLIKGVLDFRYLIMASGIIVLALAIFYAGKFGLRFFRKMQTDGADAFRDAAGRGQPVQLDLFNGLMTFSYGGRRSPAALPGPGGPAALLPDMSSEPPPRNPPRNPIDQIQGLVQLKKDGVIDEAEFLALKKKLIQDICEGPDRTIDPDVAPIVRPHRECGWPQARSSPQD